MHGQVILPPSTTPQTFKGCPDQVFDFWAHSNDPNFEWPEFHYSTTKLQDCYNCGTGDNNELVDVCNQYYPDPAFCPNCINLVTLTMVYNPRTQQYETIFVVKQYTINGIKEWYTYKVYKVPVYGTDATGIRKIIGYKYYWNVIPELIRVEIDPNDGKTMIF